MSRLYRYYQERANEVALLGGMVNILAFVGIVININDMKETQKMEQMLLSKQWVSIKNITKLRFEPGTFFVLSGG